MNPVTVFERRLTFSFVSTTVDGAGEPIGGVRCGHGEDLTTVSGKRDSMSMESSFRSKNSLISAFKSCKEILFYIVKSIKSKYLSAKLTSSFKLFDV